MFRAAILADDGRDAAADAEFAVAAVRLRDLPDERFFVESFLAARLEVRDRLGRTAESLDEFGPRSMAFAFLASICIERKKYDLLDTIIDRCLKDDPRNLPALQRRMENRIRQGKTKEGVALYQELAAREKIEGDNGDRLTDELFYFAMLDRQLALEAYRAARDRKDAFQYLSREVESKGRPTDFDKLVEAYDADHPGDPMTPLARARHRVKMREYVQAIAQFDLAAKGKFDPKSFLDPLRQSIFARYKAGQALAAYRDLEGHEQTFAQLANLALLDRDLPLLEKLVTAHRERSPDDPALEEATARMLVFQKKPAEAARLFRKIEERRRPSTEDRRIWIVGVDLWHTFVSDMAASDQPFEAYEAAPDKKMAFELLATLLEQGKKEELLTRLVQRHAKEPEPSPRLAHHRGVAHLLRGDFAAAEKDLRRALAVSARHERSETLLYLFQAGIEQGKTVAMLREFGASDPETFRELANQCFQRKRGDQLRLLLDAEKGDPECEPRQLDGAEIDILWLAADYEGVLRSLKEHARSFERPDLRWRQGYRVRSLVKLGRFDEALDAAEAMPQEHRLPLLKVLVFAAKGDVDRTIEVVQMHARGEFDIQNCYWHEDVGPLLRGDRFARFRERFPENKTLAAFDEFDDD